MIIHTRTIYQLVRQLARWAVRAVWSERGKWGVLIVVTILIEAVISLE